MALLVLVKYDKVRPGVSKVREKINATVKNKLFAGRNTRYTLVKDIVV